MWAGGFVSSSSSFFFQHTIVWRSEWPKHDPIPKTFLKLNTRLIFGTKIPNIVNIQTKAVKTEVVGMDVAINICWDASLLNYLFLDFSPSDTKEEQMLKRPISTILIGLLHSHLPHLINHHEHLSWFMQLYNRTTAQVLPFLLPCDFLSEHDWNQTVQFSCVCITNQFTTVLIHDDAQCIFHNIKSAEFSPVNITCPRPRTPLPLPLQKKTPKK